MKDERKERKWKKEGGQVLIMVLVFMGVFVTILGGLAGYVIMENRRADIEVARQQAFYIAEAGLNYYRWHLAHFPSDMHDGMGATSTGPYVHQYIDPEGGVAGGFSLQVSGNRSCGDLTSINITSTGYSKEFPDYTRTVHARYARPSVAQFLFIFNTPVWFGDNETIKGPVQSNSGIRMDGTSHSKMESAVSSWNCTETFLCNPSKTVPGIFGTGVDQALWKFPVPQVDFTGLSVDLAQMKQKAQDSGLYFPALPGYYYGYHVVFKNDGTFDLYKVTKTQRVKNSADGRHWQRSRNIILQENFVGNYSVPGDCSLIFVEDKLWIEGSIDGKVTIAAASVADPNEEADVILNGNISYKDSDGSDGLMVLSEGNILIPKNAPDNMELDGIFIAQNGKFGMNYFPGYGGRKDTLNIFGTVVSNLQGATTWVNSSGDIISGFQHENDAYNQSLVTAPPPLTPRVSDQYQFVSWSEKRAP